MTTKSHCPQSLAYINATKHNLVLSKLVVCKDALVKLITDIMRAWVQFVQ